MMEPKAQRDILIIDPDQESAEHLRAELAPRGYRVECVHSFSEACRALQVISFQLLLSEVDLADGSGLELLDVTEAQHLPPKLLFITADIETETIIEALRKGACDYLLKPLDLPRLLATLEYQFKLNDEARDQRQAEQIGLMYERQLEESNNRMRLMVERMPLGCIVWDIDFRITLWNPEAERIFGYSEKEALGRHSYELIVPPEEQDHVEDLFRQILAGESAAHSTNENIAKGGRTLLCEWHNTPLRDANGQVVGAISMVQDVTAREQAEQTLRESEERFRTVFQTTPNAVLLAKLSDGRVVDCNESVAAISGFPREEIIGKNSQEIGIWDDPHDRQRMYEQLQEKGFVNDMEYVYRRKDGSTGHALLSARKVNLRSEPHLLIVSRDISALKQAEQEREHARELADALIDSLPGIFFMIDDKGMLLRWNDNYQQALGYSEEDLRGEEALTRNPQGEHAKLRAAIAEAFRSGSVSVESNHLTKAGEAKPYFYSAKRLDVAGNRYLVGVGIDISERVAAERALRESEERFRRLYKEFETLLNGIPDALVLLNPELMIVWSNRGAEEHFGAQLGTLPGKHCKELWGLDEELCENCIQKTFDEGITQEKIHNAADGRVWGMKVFPIKDLDGRVANVIQISSDLTEKVALREEADRASRLAALGEMAAGVAHEINNPNGMIMISLNLVAQAIRDGRGILDKHFDEQGDFSWGGIKYSRMRDEIPRLVEEMQDSALRIKNTVEELKGFSRRDLQSDYEILDLNSCIEGAVRLTKADCESAGAELFTDLVAALPHVRGVQQRIEQILVNLISNACHALDGDNNNIEVRSRISADGEKVLVSVRDHGIGIAPQHLERLTDPFFTTRREVGGTGLGLSLSARMAKEHGGRLEFASSPEEGTTASLILPVHREGQK